MQVSLLQAIDTAKHVQVCNGKDNEFHDTLWLWSQILRQLRDSYRS